MYATIRRYRTNGGESESSSELVRDILEGFVPLIAETVAAHYVVDAGDGVIATISICEDEEKVRTSNRIAAEWVKQHLASRIARQEELRSVTLEVDDPVQGVLHEGISEPVYKRALQLLSVQEVGGLLGMGRSWVYEQIKSGELAGVHLGGSVKVRREDLERYIEARRR
jgi:excisionase family DNA binding protein